MSQYMDAPFFSIVIPTRNRYETLKHTMLTVLNQDFDSYELIIADNSDNEVLEQSAIIKEYLQNPKVKYHRPPSVLSMSDNWEFAVSQTKGEYIIIFGDDDGLVAGALRSIHHIIGQTRAPLVSWARIEYSWPDRMPEQFSNLMVIPYMAKTGVTESKQYIKKVIRYEADYRYLPMFYNSAVSRKTVNLLKEKTGRIFNASSPDIYTGFAFAHLMKSYLIIGQPLSINGVSSKSNGAAHSRKDESGKADHWNLLKKSSIIWPDTLPHFYTAYMGIIEPFVQLSHAFPELQDYISRKKIYKIIIDSLDCITEKDLQDKSGIILESAKNDASLYKWVKQYLQKSPPALSKVNLVELDERVGFDGAHLVLNGSKFGLNNVYDVSIFIDNLFGNLKVTDFTKPVELQFSERIRKAAGTLLRT